MRRVPIAGASLLALGIAALVQASRYEFGTLRLPGPGFLPSIAGLLLVAAAAWIAADHVRAPAPRNAEPAERGGVARVIACILAVAVFPLLLAPMGFLGAAALLLLVLFTLGAGRFGLRPLLLALTAAVACDVLFRLILKVPLPAGLLWGP